jgi:hypothetical protein
MHGSEPDLIEIEVNGAANVRVELSGRVLFQERVNATAMPASLPIQVTVGVFIYVQRVDEHPKLEFIFVCGHLRDMPDDGTARPYVGGAKWAGGSVSMWKLEALQLGSHDCLKLLQSLVLTPRLTRGSRYEAVPWEDTSDEDHHACQFLRCLTTPVRIGKIY